MFQSLFSWIILGDPKSRRGRHATRRVSILVLVDYPGRPLASLAMPGGKALFQSLFSWIILGDLVVGNGFPTLAHVSILVLVDHPGRPHFALTVEPFVWGFNPCSRGSSWAT